MYQKCKAYSKISNNLAPKVSPHLLRFQFRISQS